MPSGSSDMWRDRHRSRGSGALTIAGREHETIEPVETRSGRVREVRRGAGERAVGRVGSDTEVEGNPLRVHSDEADAQGGVFGCGTCLRDGSWSLVGRPSSTNDAPAVDCQSIRSDDSNHHRVPIHHHRASGGGHTAVKGAPAV